MAEIASIFLSPFLQVFFEKMASRDFVDFFRGRSLKDGLLRKLKTTLLSVNAVLEDAEDKQFTKPDVKDWLDELKDAIYDAEDILDEIATKDLQWKLDARFGIIASKVRNPISASLFVNKIEEKIKDAVDRLEDLERKMSGLALRAGVGGQPFERVLPTTSLVEISDVLGRHDDKEAIINSMLSDGANGDEMGVIAIVGMGGIGKTTIAQLVYNDDRLNEHFDLKAWVCVSDDFDVLKITKTIVEKVTEKTYDTNDLDQLQRKLKEELMSKKFLLVLDDVWNKKYADWELLSKPFKHVGVQGSRVIVTTRNQEVASVMFASAAHRINELPKEDCWSLFVKYAFHNLNYDACLGRKALGRQILEKCKGLPLAIKAIGSLLQSKSDVKEWDNVLKSELWDLPIEEIGILPALRLSYTYLSSHLKRCFAYCSIFPKDYAFKKDKLVLLWMAEGLLPQSKNKTMEEVGDDYFLALVSRSLFQQSNHNEYIMHDLVSDLTKFISREFTLSLEDDCSHEIGSKTRHFSYFSQSLHIKKIEALHRANKLRTIVELNFFGDGSFYMPGAKFLLPMVTCLRVLILCHHEDITELPDSMGKMIHLRYLDLSYTWIKRLPDFICKLCNLQILNLSHCPFLAALPRDMRKLNNLQILNLSHCKVLAALPKDMCKLINLRHLDFAETKIMEIPINLGELRCLQTLTRFIVSKHSGSCIEELEKLTNLRGSLPILELQNAKPPTNAKDASLREVKHLEELLLEWKVDTYASESHKIVLDSLEPHSNLKSLAIKGYGGKSFSIWVGHPSFSNIASLRLRNCNHCCSFPPLGQLPSLQELFICGFHEVVTLGREFYGSRSSSIKPFRALKVLRFEDMFKWEDWFSFDVENGGGAFPQLEELYIKNCPKLTRGLPAHLPSLAKLEIHECRRLVASLPRASSQCKVILQNCNIVLLNKSQTGIQELEISQFDALELTVQSCSKLELPMHLNYSSLKYFKLYDCDSLKSFPLDLFPRLCRLEFTRYWNLESLIVRQQNEHDLLFSLMHIDIHLCPIFANFPKGGLHAPNLKEFRIRNCKSLRSLPDKMYTLLPSLEKLYIECCPQVESFPEGGLPSNLNEIYIYNCDKIFASRMGWGLQQLPSIRRFTIGGKPEDLESFPEMGLLPASLNYLRIESFPNLKSLDKKGLQHLTSLQELQIWYCPELECMPEDGLPASLSTLMIYGCPLLKEDWQTKKEKEWRKIAHVPNKYIDYRLIK